MAEAVSRLHIVTEGTPQPQGSTRVFMHAGKPKITTDNARLKPWRKHIVMAAWMAMGDVDWKTTEAPVLVSLSFAMPRGKTVKRRWHTVKPDIDKLTRGVLDALTTAEVYRDDSQVIALTVTKFYAEVDQPGVCIHVMEVESQ